MYGLINMAIKQLVTDSYGEASWKEILKSSGVTLSNFELLSSYDDSITYNLISGASKVTGKSSDEILFIFGSFWVEYATKAGYGTLISLFGPTFKDCLFNLNKMHEHMGAMMPELVPPKFDIEKENSDKDFILLYQSSRLGLTPMVSGLLVSLAKRFEIDNIDVKYLGKTIDNQADRFHIKWN